MKKILLLLVFVFYFSFSFALNSNNFTIISKDVLTGNSIVSIYSKLNFGTGFEVYVGNEQLTKIGTSDGAVLFRFPSKIDIDKIHNHIKIKLNNSFIDLGRYPVLENVEEKDNNGKLQLEFGGYFTGNCKLFVNNTNSLGVSIKGNYAYVDLPQYLTYDIDKMYMECNDLKSNYIYHSIHKSPYIDYIIAENKKSIIPGSYVLLKGNGFKLNEDDNVKLFVNDEEVKDFYVQNPNTIKFQLPEKNMANISIKVQRNYFVSNILKIDSFKTPYITKVNTISKKGKNYFRILGYFPKNLGKVQVFYGDKSLNIDYVSDDYIDVSYPSVSYDSNGKISCSYYINRDYFTVKIGDFSSNKYFYYDINTPYIVSTTTPVCSNNKCNMKVYFSYPVKKGQLYLNNELLNASFASSIARAYMDKLILKGNLYYVSENCVISPVYSFDFTRDYRPIIREISSERNFTSADRVDIIGEKLNDDGTFDNLNTKVSFNPNILDKNKKIVFDRSSITAFLKNQLEKGQEVKISLSNKHGDSNGGHFVVGGNKTYMGNPYIKNISYENGGEGGQKAIINGLNFSKTCSKDKIKFANKVLYPNECDYNKLVFTIPEDLQTDNIVVNVDGYDSEKYILNSKIGGTLVGNKDLAIHSVYTQNTIYTNKTKTSKIEFKFINTISDLYLSRLEFFIKTDSEVFPFSNFVLKINGDDKKYYYLMEQKRLMKSNLQNKAYVEKVKGGYKVIFQNIFMPFSITENTIELDFDVSDLDDINNTIFDFYFPKQVVYYYNVYKDDFKIYKKSFNKDIELSKYKIVSTKNVCFDSKSDYSNCSLVLMGKNVKSDNKVKPNITKPVNNNVNNNSKQTVTNQNVKKTNKSKLELRKERIAKNLTLKKMVLLNKLIKRYILKQRDKYRKNMEMLYKILPMYKAYRKMELNTKSDLNSKLKYVDALFDFAYAYISYKKHLSSN